jgi:hypothetical protein
VVPGAYAGRAPTREATVSFLLDPPLLVTAGAAIERFVADQRLARTLETGVATAFVAGSTAIYLESPAFRRVWESFGEPSGRDFMWNSGVLEVEHEGRGPGVHVLAAGILATYPLWVRLGRRLARSLSDGS